ncbi:MAG: GGDEF domain-containing protein, partial [Symbiobacteriia bacterium]
FEQLEPEVARALRYSFPLSVLIVDLDYFKFYNDRLGHVAGDMALRRFGDVLRTGSREGDLIARYGGEEFIIALSHTDCDAALLYAERLRENVQEMYGHGPVQLTVSVGIASLPGYESLDALVQAADAALYQAKGQRNRVTVAVPESGPSQAAE